MTEQSTRSTSTGTTETVPGEKTALTEKPKLTEKTELRERLCAALGAVRGFPSAVRDDRELRIVLIFPALVLAVLAFALVRYVAGGNTEPAVAAPAPAAPSAPAPAAPSAPVAPAAPEPAAPTGPVVPVPVPPPPAREQRPDAVSSPTTTAAPPAQPGRLHRVTRGETLAAVALHTGVDYQRIATDNHLPDVNRLRTGQELRIGQPTPGTVVIRRGETLNRIAAAHGTTVRRLLELNPWITDPHRIPAGAGLRVQP